MRQKFGTPLGREIVVEDIDAAIEFFTELGLELEGRAPIEGDWAGAPAAYPSESASIERKAWK